MTDAWLTADQHWGHARIIQHCKRPFHSVDEMDEAMIHRWNVLIKPGDVVYHLGDFCWSDPDKYRRRLNGEIRLVTGNHDNRIGSSKGFIRLGDLATIEVDGAKIVLCHYPLQEWEGAFRGWVHMHGHTHGTVKDIKGRLDIGVDRWAFAPVSMKEIRDRLEKLGG